MLSRHQAYLALLTNTILWGIASPIIKHGLDSVTPLYFLTYRFIIVVALITPLFLAYLYVTKTKVKHLKNLFLIGFLSNPINLYLLFIGINKTSALDASVLASLLPIFFAIAGAIFLREKVTNQEKTGIGIALFGTLIFTLQPLLSRQEIGQSSFIGNVIIIIGQLVYIVAMIISKKEKEHSPPFVQAYFSWLSAVIFFVPLAFLTNTISPGNLMEVFFSSSLPHILYMAIFGSIIAFLAYVYGQSKIETSEAAVFTYLQPLFAAPLAVFWLGEKITLPFIIGCTLIIVGVILSETRKKIF